MARLNEPPPPTESVDARLSLRSGLRARNGIDANSMDEVKRRFIRQNRDLAK